MKIGKQKVVTFIASAFPTMGIFIWLFDFITQYGGGTIALSWILTQAVFYLLINGIYNSIKK